MKQPHGITKQGRHLNQIMEFLSQEMKVNGYITIKDYNVYMELFRHVTKVDFLEDITVDTIY